jgi:hypothetical protein
MNLIPAECTPPDRDAFAVGVDVAPPTTRHVMGCGLSGHVLVVRAPHLGKVQFALVARRF